MVIQDLVNKCTEIAQVGTRVGETVLAKLKSRLGFEAEGQYPRAPGTWQ